MSKNPEVTDLGQSLLDERDRLRKEVVSLQADVMQAARAASEGRALVEELQAERNVLQAQLNDMRDSHPRAAKLMIEQKEFIVIAIDEPYFKDAYDLIRANEIKSHSWGESDEWNYKRLIEDVKI